MVCFLDSGLWICQTVLVRCTPLTINVNVDEVPRCIVRSCTKPVYSYINNRGQLGLQRGAVRIQLLLAKAGYLPLHCLYLKETLHVAERVLPISAEFEVAKLTVH